MIKHPKSRILITGANGFIGKNLIVRLNELQVFTILTFVRGDDPSSLLSLVTQVDFIMHLAGENRPLKEGAFQQVNVELTSTLCNAIEQEFRKNGRHVPLLLTSSTQAVHDNPYGRSKLAAEAAVKDLARETGNPCVIFRLPGVFGKWCKSNYNSVVSTYCHNIAHDLPIQINDPGVDLRLVYVDDVITAFLSAIHSPAFGCVQAEVEPEYTVNISELADQIYALRAACSTLLMPRVGTGFARALYATYMSYLPREKFSYELRKNVDPRGVFVEMLKTSDSGQFSYFTAYSGITRGGHYHHTKSEKFLVVKGEALFSFRHLLTDELVELRTSADIPTVVDTIPGWKHDITNIGEDEMIVILWANENFSRDRPDTFPCKVLQ